jgi:hypothetical protein
MALVNNKNTSSIAMALAGITASVDISKPCVTTLWSGRETFAAVAARSLPSNKQPAGLPTPPNSISPSLPPQHYKGHTSVVPTTPPAHHHVDSDIDLQDAVDHAKAQDQSQHSFTGNNGLDKLADLDATGAITPGLLAKHHLPGILLDNGPLAIRHVMSYLTTSVPGFSSIPPAKARRLVVGALEGRGSGGEQGGIDGDVIFEKVGWGRWDAKRRGQSSRDSDIRPVRHSSPQSQGGLRIPGGSSRNDRGRGIAFSHDSEMEYDDPSDDINVLDHEADKMSLDGDGSHSSSDPPSEAHPLPPFDNGDVTDEEDWRSIGAAALRQGSYPRTSGGVRKNSYPTHLAPRAKSRGRSRGPPTSTLAKSMPMRTSKNMYNNHHQQQQPPAPDFAGFSASDSQEREAVQALLKLGSV